MKKTAIAILLIVCMIDIKAQDKIRSLQDFMNAAGIQPAKVMLLGTFHFAYQNLDAHKTEKKNMRNILSEQSQKELQELLAVLKRYNPTRIYLEASDQHWLDSCYNACNETTFKTQANERVQIGYRLAKELKHTKVYCVDAEELYSEWNAADSLLLVKLLGSDSIPDKKHADLLNRIYSNYYKYSDSLNANLPLLQALIRINDPRNLQLNHGAYISNYFNTLSNCGPDFLAAWWVDRNLRIFNNVLLTKPTGSDRILLVFGAGHVPLLKHSFESSPDFEYIDFYQFAKKKQPARHK